MHIKRVPFGIFYNQSVNQIVMTNNNGMSVSILELGGIISNLFVPNDKGEIADVVLGLNNIGDYVRHDSHYFGALIGRVANRIQGAQFELAGEKFVVNGNAYHGKHCVHGGRFGYHRRVWQESSSTQDNDKLSITFKLIDSDGEEGFKNSVTVFATYRLNNDNQLSVEFQASADGPTPISLTGHSYFNLFGHQYGSIAEHKLTIYADTYLQQKEDRIPSGKLIPAQGKAFNLQSPTLLKEAVENQEEVNHSYVFNQPDDTSTKLKKMATLEGDGRVLTLYSDEKTLHFYNGHNLDAVKGKENTVYPRYAGLCLEPKGYVNAINQAEFPCTIIDSKNQYQHTIVYDFK